MFPTTNSTNCYTALPYRYLILLGICPGPRFTRWPATGGLSANNYVALNSKHVCLISINIVYFFQVISKYVSKRLTYRHSQKRIRLH